MARLALSQSSSAEFEGCVSMTPRERLVWRRQCGGCGLSWAVTQAETQPLVSSVPAPPWESLTLRMEAVKGEMWASRRCSEAGRDWIPFFLCESLAARTRDAPRVGIGGMQCFSCG